MSLIKNSYRIERYLLKDDGRYPNNENWPVLLYRSILNVPSFMPTLRLSRLFKQNKWSMKWTGGINSHHHYHSNTPEMLCICEGETMLLLGGDQGTLVTIEKGDILIIPPGVAHKNMDKEDGVKCVGAYPIGKEIDLKFGDEGERPVADLNIQTVPLPKRDPVLGYRGGIQKYWL